MIYDLIILGAGASGVSTYLRYKELNKNKKVLLIDSNTEILRKLSISGNGKCNISNENIKDEFYNNSLSFKSVINDNSALKMKEFFNKFNIYTITDDEGRIYPYNKSAKSIQSILLEHINKDELLLNTKILSISKEDDLFILKSKDLVFKSKRLVLSIGNKNYSTLGSDGLLFSYITDLGHSFTDIIPSNIYINVKEKDITKALSGLRFKANLMLYNDNKLYYKEKGELLFKDDALSGIVSFNVSSKLAYLIKNKLDKSPYILVDYVFDINESKLKELINSGALKSLIDPKLLTIINSKKMDIIDSLKRMKFTSLSLNDFSHAQVSCGGIKTEEIDTNTLESKIVKNLYFTGDLLDNDAVCGGYNLSFAILSGMIVGENIHE